LILTIGPSMLSSSSSPPPVPTRYGRISPSTCAFVCAGGERRGRKGRSNGWQSESSVGESVCMWREGKGR
jgi:hypothetical protein